jgi:PPM family protein phosphatase
MVKRQSIGLSDTGIIRSANQDSHYLDPQGRFFIVADGMGGHAGGQEASEMAIKTIRSYFEEHWESDQPSNTLIIKAVNYANESIIEDQHINPEREEMGTTIVLALFRNDGNWRGHVGDSRLYRFRNSQLEQLTIDHTWVAKALQRGELTEEQVKEHPWRHVLFQCLGRKDLRLIDVEKLEVLSGDLLLLCSDGLTEEVSDAAINEFLTQSTSCETIAKNLIEAAKSAGGSDNITVVLINEN